MLRVYCVPNPERCSCLEACHKLLEAIKFLACGAGESIKPGVERSGTPGSDVQVIKAARDAGVSAKSYEAFLQRRFHPLRGFETNFLFNLPGG